jgi:hypothetical protein
MEDVCFGEKFGQKLDIAPGMESGVDGKSGLKN